MGPRDVHNLAWKIVLVMHKNEPHSTFNSYEVERHLVADQIIKLLDHIFEVSMALACKQYFAWI